MEGVNMVHSRLKIMWLGQGVLIHSVNSENVMLKCRLNVMLQHHSSVRPLNRKNKVVVGVVLCMLQRLTVSLKRQYVIRAESEDIFRVFVYLQDRRRDARRGHCLGQLQALQRAVDIGSRHRMNIVTWSQRK